MEELKDKILRYVALTLMIAIVIGGAIFAWPSLERSRALSKQEEELVIKIAQKREQIAQLSENQRRFKTDPDFVEHIARQNRRVFPGELVFIFEPEK